MELPPGANKMEKKVTSKDGDIEIYVNLDDVLDSIMIFWYEYHARYVLCPVWRDSIFCIYIYIYINETWLFYHTKVNTSFGV
jgi:hypothetical protein